jgi:hypothetical protein
MQDVSLAMAPLNRYLAAPVRSLPLKSEHLCALSVEWSIISIKRAVNTAMTLRPTADQIKQPDRPKLADIMGPGLITGDR